VINLLWGDYSLKTEDYGWIEDLISKQPFKSVKSTC